MPESTITETDDYIEIRIPKESFRKLRDSNLHEDFPFDSGGWLCGVLVQVDKVRRLSD